MKYNDLQLFKIIIRCTLSLRIHDRTHPLRIQWKPIISEYVKIDPRFAQLGNKAQTTKLPNRYRYLLKNPTSWSQDVNSPLNNQSGKPTLLIYAIQLGNYLMIDVLLNMDNIDIGVRNMYGASPLYVACEFNRIDILKQLLSHPKMSQQISYNDTTDMGWTPLMCACERNTELVRVLLENDVYDAQGEWFSLDPVNDTGQCALVIAVLKNNIETVKLLLNSGCDVNQADGSGVSPLIHSIKKTNRRNILELLLKEDLLDINQADKQGNTPLIIACIWSDASVVELLLNNPRIDVNKTNIDIDSALLILIEQEQEWSNEEKFHIYSLLLSSPGINVNQINEHGNTPLLIVCEDNNTELFELLLQNPSLDVNKASDDTGITPLICAINQNNIDMILLLLKQGNIDINKGNTVTGVGPLRVAVEKGKSNIVQLLLLQKGIVVNNDKYMNQGGRMNMIGHLCCLTGQHYIQILRILLDYIDVNMFVGSISGDSSLDETALHIACRHNNKSMVRLLLQRTDIDANKVNSRGDTPLCLAISSQNDDETIELLLNKADASTASIDTQDHLGRTALNNACRSYRTNVVKLLLEMGKIDVNKADNVGLSPLATVCLLYNVNISAEKGTACINIVNRLLEYTEDTANFVRVNVNQVDIDGMTPLDFIVRNDILDNDLYLGRGARYPVNLAMLIWEHGGRQGMPLLIKKGLERKKLHQRVLHTLDAKPGGGSTAVGLIGRLLHIQQKCQLKF